MLKMMAQHNGVAEAIVQCAPEAIPLRANAFHWREISPPRRRPSLDRG